MSRKSVYEIEKAVREELHANGHKGPGREMRLYGVREVEDMREKTVKYHQLVARIRQCGWAEAFGINEV